MAYLKQHLTDERVGETNFRQTVFAQRRVFLRRSEIPVEPPQLHALEASTHHPDRLLALFDHHLLTEVGVRASPAQVQLEYFQGWGRVVGGDGMHKIQIIDRVPIPAKVLLEALRP